MKYRTSSDFGHSPFGEDGDEEAWDEMLSEMMAIQLEDDLLAAQASYDEGASAPQAQHATPQSSGHSAPSEAANAPPPLAAPQVHKWRSHRHSHRGRDFERANAERGAPRAAPAAPSPQSFGPLGTVANPVYYGPPAPDPIRPIVPPSPAIIRPTLAPRVSPPPIGKVKLR